MLTGSDCSPADTSCQASFEIAALLGIQSFVNSILHFTLSERSVQRLARHGSCQWHDGIAVDGVSMPQGNSSER